MTGEQFRNIGRSAIVSYICPDSDSLSKEEYADHFNNVLLVWYCKTIQNHKALFYSPEAHQTYFEFTWNGDKSEGYLDIYKKDNKWTITENKEEEDE